MRQLIYPVPQAKVEAPPAGLEEVLLPLAGGIEVVGWHRPGKGLSATAPAVLFFHGNGENLETMRWAGLFSNLQALDLPLLAIDYPGYGRSSGRPSEGSLKESAETALAWLKNRHRGRAVATCGWSLGAALAVHLAAARPEEVDALIAMSSWTSLQDVASVHFPRWLVGIGLREQYGSLAVAGQIACPSLIVHGRADRIIPIGQGEQLAAAVAGSVWLPVEGAGHNDLLGFPEVWLAVSEFLRGIGGA